MILTEIEEEIKSGGFKRDEEGLLLLDVRFIEGECGINGRGNCTLLFAFSLTATDVPLMALSQSYGFNRQW